MGQNRVIEPVGLGEIAAFQVVVVTVQKLYHTVHKGAVLGGLEGIGLKILVIVHKIKGEGGELLSLLSQLRGADCGYQAGIHAP